MDLKETYNRIAEDWHRDHQQDDWWIKGTDKFISFLKPGNLVLDVGCGGGTKAKYLLNNGLRVMGIDFSEKMIEIAKKEVPRAEFLVMDLNDTEKLGYDFDGIFIQAVLLHIPKKEFEENLKRIVKKLKNNGYIYIAVKERRPEGLEEEIRAENDYGYPYERFFSYFTTDEIYSCLHNIGCVPIFSEITPSGNTRWIQVIAKK